MLDYLKTAQAQGRLGAAEASFARILGEAPTHVYAWLGLGYCASLSGRRDAALQAFQSAAALDAVDEDAALACARALCQAGEPEAARLVLAARPESLRQQMALGELEDGLGRHEAALRHFRAAHVCDPTADEPLLTIIRLLKRCGADDAALEAIDRLIAISPKNRAAASLLRGQIHTAAGAREAAVAAWREGVAHDPLADPIRTALALALRQSGAADEARRILQSGRPSYGLSLALAELELAARNHEAALRHAAAAHARQPKRPDPLRQMARIEADRGNAAAAQAAADRIETACGPEYRLTALRCRLALSKDIPDETAALAILSQMTELAPDDAGIWADLARHHRLTGDPAGARRAAQTALTCDPDNRIALFEAAAQAGIAEDRVAELAFYRRALATAPEQVAHHVRVARLLHDLGQLDEAAEALDAAEARFGRSLEIRGERIRWMRDRGEVHEALAAARTACAAHPAHFGRWLELFTLELQLSPVETVVRCLDLAPAQSRAEEAKLHAARGRLALRLRDTDTALAQFEASLALDADNRGVLTELFGIHLRALDVARAARCHDGMGRIEAHQRRMRGTTANPSQSHHGQLLNDCRVDRRAILDLCAIRALPADERIAGFLAFIRQRPEHIPGAMALLVALRDGGWFDRPRPPAPQVPGAGAIPRHIGQFWDADEPPPDLRELSRSWSAQNTGYGHVLFNDRTAQAYLTTHFPPPVVMAYRRCEGATTQSDLFRLAFLFRHGGIWADMDDRCLVPLSHIVPAGAAACFWQESTAHLCNNFMAAVPGHPVVRRALATAVQAINRGDRDKVWMLTGPGLLSRAFAVEMAAAGDAWPDWLGSQAVLDEYALHPAIAIHCRTSHKRLGRHWLRTAFAQTVLPSSPVAA
jgi:tetratricopeptide (TPR) repeat protein